MTRAAGFSLVECVVAVVLCAAGLLALAGSTRAMLALAELGQRTAGGAQIAAARLATLHGAGCAATGGEAASGLYQERWVVAGDGSSRTVTVAVTFRASGTWRTSRYQAVVRCPR